MSKARFESVNNHYMMLYMIQCCLINLAIEYLWWRLEIAKRARIVYCWVRPAELRRQRELIKKGCGRHRELGVVVFCV